VIRLPRPGCISGTVRDGEGAEVIARVHLLGRHPASLAREIVASVNSTPLQGFEVRPHEAGEFDLAVEADAGWALHRGKTGPEAIAGAEVRLLPWGAVRGRVDASRHLSRIRVEPIDAPPLGRARERPALGLEGSVDRLPAGKYRVTLEYASGPAANAILGFHAAEVEVAAGGTAEVVAPR